MQAHSDTSVSTQRPDTVAESIRRDEESGASPDLTTVVKDCSLVVPSIGDAGIRVISALRAVTGVTDTQLAELLFQAPSVLAKNLTRDIAEQVSSLLQEMGLETSVLGPDESIESGDDLH